MNERDVNNWESMKRLVVFRLDHMAKELQRINHRLSNMETAVATKAGMWGGLAGLAAALTALVYLALK